MRLYMHLTFILLAFGCVACQSAINDFLSRFTSPKPIEFKTTTSPTPPPLPRVGTVTTPGTTGAVACIMDDGRSGYCVLQRMCRNGRIVTTGSGAIKPRISSVCPLTTQVCCELTQPVTTSTTTTTTPPVTAPAGRAKLCGFMNKNGVARAAVTGGIREANFGEYPWAVPIFEVDDGVEDYIAGGSLIHPRLVLTTASPFNSDETYVVKAGDWDINRDTEILESQRSEVTEVIKHSGFSSGRMSNNIALLLLATAILADKDNIGFACLPNTGAVTATGTACFGTGWGPNNIDENTADTPKKVRLPIVDRMDCQTRLRMVANPRLELDNSVMCAGGEAGVDTCKRDGGSPLMCQYPGNKRRVYVAGLVSWGIGCGVAGRPAMYTDVAALRPWIDQTVAAKGLENTYYTAP